MIQGYDRDKLVKSIEKKKFGELEKFALDNAGSKKTFKLREVLERFDPVHLTMYMVGVCGRKIKVKLNTFDFPDGEHRVGIEFTEVV
ncbi:MAG: hypothetical protein PVJ05_04925 [Candidatus Thorarchaeota archaeon]|jgi:hypothetical protein